MNKILTVIMAALTSAAAFGELSWAAVSTAAYGKDTSPSASGTSAYTAYLCTKEAAAEEFGSGEIGKVTTYFANNFSKGAGRLSDLTSSDSSAKLQYGATALDTVTYGAGQYTFMTRFADGVALNNLVVGSEYLGIILYSSGDDQAVRVFSATASGNGPTWVADDSTSRGAGSAGAWTAAIPEPTSGILFLLGLAGLGLRRSACGARECKICQILFFSC